MDNQNELSIGPRASALREKIQQNRLYEDDRPATREEEAKRAAKETGGNFMTAVSKQEEELVSLLSHGCRLVGNVEVASVSAEVLAVTDNECQSAKWREELGKDEEETERILILMNNEWEKTITMEVAEELQAALSELKVESTKLVIQKRRLVDGIQRQLETADKCFQNERFSQSQQRTQILSRVTEHVIELIKAYRNSLRSLHITADSNQDELTDYYTKEIDKASNELNIKLQDLMKQRQSKRRERLEELINIHVHGIDRTTNGKRSREDVEEVLLELYRLRTRQKVEEEQLQFNLGVLRQQLKETTFLVSEGRRKINELRPTVTDLRRQWEKHEKVQSRNQRQKFMEIMLKKEKLRAMKGRLSQLSIITSSQLRGVAYMRYTQLQDIVMKINELERSIELTVLSRDFIPADMSLLMELHPGLQPKDTPALAAVARIFGPPEDDYDFEVCEEERMLEESFLKETVKAADFLVSSADEMSFESESPPLLTLEHIFWELGIKSEHDVNMILDSAKRKWYAQRSKVGEIVNKSPGHKIIFTTEEVLTTLIEFSKERAKRDKLERMKEAKATFHSAFSGALLMTEEDEAKWMKLVEEMTGERNKSWKVIRDALKKYLLVLNGRQHESEIVENLRRENRELRHLLLGGAGFANSEAFSC